MLLLTLTHIKMLVLLCYLMSIAIIVFFSWLYLTRTVHATREIGLQAPEYLKGMVKISISLALFTAFLITLFLLMNIY